ncbi:MAG: rhodanese-related sulfurtransferase [Candidatus Pseudothioglobus sp.]|jgi:rhodanese-related sulfurtransferase
MTITTGVEALVANAMAQIKTLSLTATQQLIDSDNAVIVDIRDVRELHREGKIFGAVHAPRGMLEFWVDPDSPYHREVFAQDKTYVLYCASAFRSALAAQTLQQMGMFNVAHIEGGFTAWKAAQLPIEAVAKQ